MSDTTSEAERTLPAFDGAPRVPDHGQWIVEAHWDSEHLGVIFYVAEAVTGVGWFVHPAREIVDAVAYGKWLAWIVEQMPAPPLEPGTELGVKEADDA